MTISFEVENEVVLPLWLLLWQAGYKKEVYQVRKHAYQINLIKKAVNLANDFNKKKV
jgi:hypothetical protein